MHNKDLYNFVDYLGDLGGLIEIIFFLAAFIIRPISRHSYFLKIISKLFFTKTSDDSLLKPPKTKLKGDQFEKQIQITELIGLNFKKGLMNQRFIRIHLKDSIMLFVYNMLPWVNKPVRIEKLSKI